MSSNAACGMRNAESEPPGADPSLGSSLRIPHSAFRVSQDPWYIRHTLIGLTLLIVGVLVVVPLASVFVMSRSIASTRSRPPAIRSITVCTCCSGSVKMTLIGCIRAMIASGVAAEADTMLPASTRRRPTRPEIGAVGRLSLGGYHALGDPALFGESARLSPSSLRTGVIAAWERTMSEVSDRLWMAVDLQTGLNAFSAASVGVAWKLAPSASVMLGYNHMLDRASYPSTLYLALDADLDLRSPGGS